MKRDPVAFLKEECEELVRQGLNWTLKVLGSPSQPWRVRKLWKNTEYFKKAIYI